MQDIKTNIYECHGQTRGVQRNSSGPARRGTMQFISGKHRKPSKLKSKPRQDYQKKKSQTVDNKTYTSPLSSSACLSVPITSVVRHYLYCSLLALQYVSQHLFGPSGSVLQRCWMTNQQAGWQIQLQEVTPRKTAVNAAMLQKEHTFIRYILFLIIKTNNCQGDPDAVML